MTRAAATINVPVIHTARLTIDAPREEDFAGYASIVTTDRGRFIGGPLDPEEAWLDFCQMVAGWVLRGYGALSVRPRGEDTYLGTVLVHHERGDPEPEFGWLFVASAEGRGLAYEAGAATLDWAFSRTALRTLVSYMDPDNARAITLARRLGGRPDDQGPPGVTTYRYDAARA